MASKYYGNGKYYGGGGGRHTRQGTRHCSYQANGFDYENHDYCVVYTDGSCLGNGQPGAAAGIGVFFKDENPLNLAAPLNHSVRPTNINAEIRAVTTALNILKHNGITKVKLYTDCEFVVRSVTEWMDGWIYNNWTRTNGRPVENSREFKKLNRARQGLDVIWCFVPGHSGYYGNERANALAIEGAKMYWD